MVGEGGYQPALLAVDFLQHVCASNQIQHIMKKEYSLFPSQNKFLIRMLTEMKSFTSLLAAM
jgi:hypothetical protein